MDKIDIQTTEFTPDSVVRVGNVYPVRGGRGARDGNFHVILHVVPSRCRGGDCGCSGAAGSWCRQDTVLLLVVNKSGCVVGVNSYGMHVVENWAPVAFVEGLEDLKLTMRSI